MTFGILIGTSEFDSDDEDWLCNEVTDFGTREEPFWWCQKAEWNELLAQERYKEAMEMFLIDESNVWT